MCWSLSSLASVDATTVQHIKKPLALSASLHHALPVICRRLRPVPCSHPGVPGRQHPHEPHGRVHLPRLPHRKDDASGESAGQRMLRCGVTLDVHGMHLAVTACLQKFAKASASGLNCARRRALLGAQIFVHDGALGPRPPLGHQRSHPITCLACPCLTCASCRLSPVRRFPT